MAVPSGAAIFFGGGGALIALPANDEINNKQKPRSETECGSIYAIESIVLEILNFLTLDCRDQVVCYRACADAE